MKLHYTGKNHLETFLKKKKKISEKHKIRRVKKNNIFYWYELVAKCLCCTKLCIWKDTYNSVSALGILHFHSCFWHSILSSGHITRKLKKDLKNSKELKHLRELYVTRFMWTKYELLSSARTKKSQRIQIEQ